jgi:hypothetical protein
MYPHNSTFDESDPPLYSHSPEEAAALVQPIIDAREANYQALKRLADMVESANARAEAAEERPTLQAYRELLDAKEAAERERDA